MHRLHPVQSTPEPPRHQHAHACGPLQAAHLDTAVPVSAPAIAGTPGSAPLPQPAAGVQQQQPSIAGGPDAQLVSNLSTCKSWDGAECMPRYLRVRKSL